MSRREQRRGVGSRGVERRGEKCLIVSLDNTMCLTVEL